MNDNHSKITSIHLIIRLTPGDEGLLASTIDALSRQSYPYWALDIVSILPAPDGFETIECLSWKVAPDLISMHQTINQLVQQRAMDWIIELPAGAEPAPDYLARLQAEVQSRKLIVALFVDDEIKQSTDKNQTIIRYKPGINPAALLTSDLSGPLCIKHSAWVSIGGAPSENRRPWFHLLLKIVAYFDWKAIHHIPSCLIKFQENVSSEHESCQNALISHYASQGIPIKILTATKTSWNIQYPLPSPAPFVSIAILSKGNIKLIAECLDSILKITQYKNYDVIISTPIDESGNEIKKYIAIKKNNISIRTITAQNSKFSAISNAAVNASTNQYVILLKDESRVIQESWLEELLRPALQPGIVAVLPRQIQPGSALIENAGSVLGLNGFLDSPYRGQAKFSDSGYLDAIQTERDVSTLQGGCFLVHKTHYEEVGGMDEEHLTETLSEAEFGIKLRKNSGRIIYQPLSNIAFQKSPENDLPKTPEELARHVLTKIQAENVFMRRYWPAAAIDPFWNPKLSLSELQPTPEAEFQPEWHDKPWSGPRILARHISNGQGFFRITSPLYALRNAGMAQACLWVQDSIRDFSPAELIRLAPDTFIVENYVADQRITALDQYFKLPGRPFIVFALDDLITKLATSNPMRITIPPNIQARLKYALARCDRMVVSTDYLAEAYQHLIPDIRVVPNRLEQGIWLALKSKKNTCKKPRIGWAGGTSHQDDLLLLKEIIEQTRHEADWIFMGMCPEEIRPLLSEYHPLTSFHSYPKYLASLNLDIAVAPLADTDFNRGKSNLRLLEYGMLGIPVVCTDLTPYQNSPAYRVKNTSQAWVSALRERIHDADTREQEGLTMRRWVCQNYLLENHLPEWLEAHLPS
jgi:O-antigen biosynthesis protein